MWICRSKKKIEMEKNPKWIRIKTKTTNKYYKQIQKEREEEKIKQKQQKQNKYKYTKYHNLNQRKEFTG